MEKRGCLFLCLVLAASGGLADATRHVNTVNSVTSAVPRGYVPPLVSNGSLCMLVDYLKKTGYPVIKECARFFLANMVYEAPNGGMFIGNCTDLERLGPAKFNPFMTSCGAIYTLEAGAKAAALLQADEVEAAAWKHAAAKLRESLPAEGDRYVPYAGCKDESVATLGGLFPYPVFDETSALQRKAVYHYVKNGRAFGNMYQMGTSVCAWYLG